MTHSSARVAREDRMNRRTGTWNRVALLCAIVVSAVACAPSAASAQSYTVYADCGNNQSWSPDTRPGYAGYTDCTGGELSGIKTYVVPENAPFSANSGGAWQNFDAPGGTRISNSARPGRSADDQPMGTQTSW